MATTEKQKKMKKKFEEKLIVHQIMRSCGLWQSPKFELCYLKGFKMKTGRRDIHSEEIDVEICSSFQGK